MIILWIDPWVRKLWYALITKELAILDSWILLQKEEQPSREDQFKRMIEIEDYFWKIFKDRKIDVVCM